MTAPYVFLDSAIGSADLQGFPPFDKCASLISLRAGDIMSLGQDQNGTIKLLIEVKELSELCQAVYTGRLPATQIPRMLQETPYVYLIYYPHIGRGHDNEIIRLDGAPSYGGTQYDTFQKWITEFEQCGVRVRSAFDRADVVRLAHSIISFYRKPWDSHGLMKCFDMSGLDGPGIPTLIPTYTEKQLARARTLSTCPGIRFQLGIRATKHFGSIANAVGASVNEWMGINGIGASKARAIVEYLSSSQLH